MLVPDALEEAQPLGCPVVLKRALRVGAVLLEALMVGVAVLQAEALPRTALGLALWDAMERLAAVQGEALGLTRALPLVGGLPDEDALLTNEALPTSVPLAVLLATGVPLALGLLELEMLEADVPLSVAEAHSVQLCEAEAAPDAVWPALALQGDAEEEAVLRSEVDGRTVNEPL